jgi:hypothetical protein
VTRRHVKAWAAIFSGAGIALVIAAWLGGSWLARGDFLLVSAFNGWAAMLTWLFALLVLTAAGQAYGAYRLRARFADQPVYGALRPRGISEFVPRWYFVALGAWMALLWAHALIVLPLLKAHPTTELLGGKMVVLPFGRWVYLATPAAALLVTVLDLALIRWTMSQPTLRFCAHVGHSAAIDASFRRESVLALLLQGSQVLFFLGFCQSTVTLDNSPRAHLDQIFLMTIPYFFIMFIGYLVVMLTMASLQQAHIAGARERVRAT